MPGNIYARLMNPTNDALEKRLAALDGGVAALTLASGTAAIYFTITNIAETGSELLGDQEVLRICCREPEAEPGQGLETVLWFDKAQKTLLRGELRSDGSTVIQCVFSAFILQQPTN